MILGYLGGSKVGSLQGKEGGRREGEREREEWERDLKMLSPGFEVGGGGQEPRASSRSWKNPGNGFSREPSEGAWPSWHPDFSTLGFILDV